MNEAEERSRVMTEDLHDKSDHSESSELAQDNLEANHESRRLTKEASTETINHISDDESINNEESNVATSSRIDSYLKEGDESSTIEAPDQPLSPYDWARLDESYHDMVKEKNDQEQQLATDFQALCQFFTIWAETSSTREVDRSFKRIKTQSTYVQHEEAVLEERRAHYVKVVGAFQAALALLDT
ncbi:hypothetical protein AAFC00_001770 [Neodothiora populina]